MCDNGYVLSGSIADPRCVRVGTGFYAVGATFVYDSSGTPSMPSNG
jgi:hypothetical protein